MAIERARRAAGLLGLAVLALSWAGPAEARGLREKILDDRYQRGDYALFLGWHDPADWQFDEQGDAGWPIGLKIRLNLTSRFLLESDLAYFRTGGEADAALSTFSVPEFDGLFVTATFQMRLLEGGPVRPYVGAGPVFASLANDYAVLRPDVREADPDNLDQRAVARWSRFDLGAQAVFGLEFPIGRRAFPFVEYRHLFGELTLEDKDVQIGQFSLPSLNLGVEDLETVPDDFRPGDVGRKYSRTYDWSGPLVMVGLKIRY